MIVEVDSNILNDYKTNITWASYGHTDAEIINSLLSEKLREQAVDGYDIDNISKCKTLFKFNYDVVKAGAEIKTNKKCEYFKTLICFDILNLKKYIDYNGLIKGDELINKVGTFLLMQFKEESVYRVGGDEFAILTYKKANEFDFNFKFDVVLKISVISLIFRIKNALNFEFESSLTKILQDGIKYSKTNISYLKRELK